LWPTPIVLASRSLSSTLTATAWWPTSATAARCIPNAGGCKVKIPVTLAAEFRGLARKAGSFERTENGATRTIEYTDAYKFEMIDADGVLADLVLSQKACDAAAVPELDTSKLSPGDRVVVEGFCADGDDGMYVKPLRMAPEGAKLKAAA
jgi:hypothetical protein